MRRERPGRKRERDGRQLGGVAGRAPGLGGTDGAPPPYSSSPVTADETTTLHSLAAEDGSQLAYRLVRASGRPRASVVYLHGIQSHGGWYVETAGFLGRRGYDVYLPDRRGSGRSEGRRGFFRDRSQLVDDVRRFVELARHEHGDLPVVLVGGCWGARPAITFALERQHELAGLVLVSPAFKAKVDLSLVEKLKVIGGGALWPRSNVRIPLTPELFTRNPRYLELIRHDPLALREVSTSFFLNQARWDRWLTRQARLQLPLLLLQAGRDEIVEVGVAQAWFERQPSSDKRAILYPDFDHLLDFEDERQRYWDDLGGWLDELTPGGSPAGGRHPPR